MEFRISKQLTRTKFLNQNITTALSGLITKHHYPHHHSVKTKQLTSIHRWLTPDSKFYGAHMGPTGPRLAPGWPHEPCYLGLLIISEIQTKQQTYSLSEIYSTMSSGKCRFYLFRSKCGNAALCLFWICTTQNGSQYYVCRKRRTQKIIQYNIFR